MITQYFIYIFKNNSQLNWHTTVWLGRRRCSDFGNSASCGEHKVWNCGYQVGVAAKSQAARHFQSKMWRSYRDIDAFSYHKCVCLLRGGRCKNCFVSSLFWCVRLCPRYEIVQCPRGQDIKRFPSFYSKFPCRSYFVWLFLQLVLVSLKTGRDKAIAKLFLRRRRKINPALFRLWCKISNFSCWINWKWTHAAIISSTIISWKCGKNPIWARFSLPFFRCKRLALSKEARIHDIKIVVQGGIGNSKSLWKKD